MTTTPPGWYDDGHGAMRWWDGTSWTEHVATPDADETAEQAAAVTVPVSAGGAPSDSDTMAYASTAGAGYPGGYPGIPESYEANAPARPYPTDGGAFIAATEPHRSRLWVVWVVLGVVVLAIVIGFSVLIPLYFMAIPSGGSSSAASPEATVPAEPSDAAPGSDEAAAATAVESFNDSILSNDCATYFASTTEAYRNSLGVTDCDEFGIAVDNFATDFQDYVLTVTSVEPDGDAMSVYTTETYTTTYDANGNDTGKLQDYEDHYAYVVISSADGWVIDESSSTDQ